jgi:hypothetical protein
VQLEDFDLQQAILDDIDAQFRELYMTKCSNHPDAPHGFDRNGSHNAGEYVCDCEGWSPDYPPSAWKVGTRLFLHRSDAVEYQSYYVHHKIIPLYE